MRLDGVRVLDLTRYLPGPYATQLLADAGADVLKIEDTDGGDPVRGMALTDADGTLFDAVNHGKRSVALNLKSDAGREAFFALAADADVLIEGFRPGVTGRLGIDDDSVREHSPEIVYCSLSGYGATGPRRARAGHDLNYAAFSGLLDMTRHGPDSRPSIPGVPVADMAGGLFAAFSIVGALYSRELGNTGGEYIDVAMTDVLLSFSQAIAPDAFADRTPSPRPGETALTGALPWYDVYETADGGYVTLAALEPAFWQAFCETVDREDLVDSHGSTDPAIRKALREDLSDVFATRTRAEWDEQFEGVDATVEPVRTLSEAIDHPQTAARDVIERSADAPPRIGFPVQSSDHADAAERVPEHGEHTAAVLREAGYDDTDLERLRETGAAGFGN
ncbi:CaiB/BaiF CoA transferase family protein [Halococcus saccharolyticus]|uniref:L-carnitine dehydratase/bile acid-inducible protein F n=1 Tax=Halococcus saccharolyticus DSM 5350 TaxID=1227455 RepID=M0MKZ3_9EURY|nr:CaiB/BaiF CoA-transferase family protein [Halococcus saccharolyticus]EMA45409.1 L-carnitine dehydratase/bile acid-inducible protein F [Halococcus saccharolyticus DSM 5350]